MSPSPRTARHAWWVAFLAGMVSYLDAGAIVTTGTALVIYKEAFGFSPDQYGQLSALLTFSIAIGAVVGGNLGDRFGRRRIFVLTLSLFIVGAGLLVGAQGTEWLYPGIVLLGFAAGADLPVSLAMIAEVARDSNRGKLVSFSHLLWMVGIVAVLGLGTAFGDLGTVGARILYGHLLVVAAIVLVLRLRLPESQAWQQSQTLAVIEPGSRGAGAFRALLTPRYLAALAATALFYSLVNIAANINGQFGAYLYVNVAGVSVSTSSAVSLVTVFVSLVAVFFMMRVVDGRNRLRWFAVMAVVSLVAFLVPALAGVSLATLVVFGVLYAIAGAVAGEPMYKVWSQELFPTAHRATAQGITIAFTRIVAAIVALYTPGLIDAGASIIFYVMAATSAVAFAIGLLWIARLPKATDDDPALRDDDEEDDELAAPAAR
ncbi:MFS transporter [Microbacterium marinilacus]|uniref:MFS transporter n=1 Tax=Microbacterium marinilacus TaxID=415209 RepID=A0ABP7B9M2_9MICO|nr:MFS transporter [Microbacterium marinilacus]MBY0687289.1 MFS transporter [Microbacterium marinilacus]